MKKITSYLNLLFIILISIALVVGANLLLKKDEKKDSGISLNIFPNITKEEVVELKEENENIKSVKKVSDDSGEKGYIFEAVAKDAFGGDIDFKIGISNEGKIQGFETISHSETEGYGAKIAEKKYQESFKDINVTNGVKPGSDNKENGEIQAISGATITTQALTKGINNVLSAMSQFTDNVKPASKEMPYYSEKFKDLFVNIPEKHRYQEFMKTDIYKESVKRIMRVYRPGKKEGTLELDSYLIYVKAQGFGGEIDYVLRINKEFRVFNVSFAKHNETENYGKYIEHKKFINAFRGLNLEKNFITKAIKLRKNPIGEKDILLISGATITSQAIQNSLNDVIETLVKFTDHYAYDSNFKTISTDKIFNDVKKSTKKDEVQKISFIVDDIFKIDEKVKQ